MYAVYLSVLPYFRRRRMRAFAKALGITEVSRVLDVGGSMLNWQWCRPRPHVTILNLAEGDVLADGRQLPFRDRSFDVVFSNSTIEHVGGTASQEAFAREVARVGVGYFVQTPNPRFPVEPHFMTPFVHFLPPRAQVRVARNFTLWGLVTRPRRPAAEAFVRSIRLVTPREMRRLFPDGQLYRERMLGMTKSLVAIRR
jgi:hypothetical protein